MTKEHLAKWVNGIDEPSESDSFTSDTTYDDEHQKNVLQSFKEFCRELDYRLEIFTGKDPSMVNIFDGDVNLRAEMIGQHVHSFIGRHLVEPTVTALEYNFIAEPRRPQPELDVDSDQIRPDFRLLPSACSVDDPPDIIGEIKTPGAASKAPAQLQDQYLDKVEPPAYGIATDGLVWYGLIRDSDGVSPLSEVGQVPVRELLHKIRRGIVHDRATYDLDQLRTSSELTRFIELFDQLPG